MVVTQHHIETIIRLAHGHSARRLILFGSSADTPEDADDIDLAVDMPGWSAFAFAEALERELSARVDVVPFGSDTEDDPFIQAVLRKGKHLL